MAVSSLGLTGTALTEGHLFHPFFDCFDQLCIIFGTLLDKGKEALINTRHIHQSQIAQDILASPVKSYSTIKIFIGNRGRNMAVELRELISDFSHVQHSAYPFLPMNHGSQR